MISNGECYSNKIIIQTEPKISHRNQLISIKQAKKGFIMEIVTQTKTRCEKSSEQNRNAIKYQLISINREDHSKLNRTKPNRNSKN
jgi:hypothetical protein